MGASVLLIVVTGVTTLVAGVVKWRSDGDRNGLLAAGRHVLELVGLAVLFFLANVALGLAIVLNVRSISSHFLSVYVLDDPSLVVLSLLQGALFFFWRRRGRGC